MANTTNFNWETPDDTDLVKDGALAIRTLGNSIDTTLVDLKGGTTGQVLSKTSNTDMDFTWVTSDDANAIQNAIVDAKGDLIAASAADTPARLAVGNNGETLVADSSTSTGLRWTGANQQNPVLNSAFDIWQRGTANVTTALVYTADRWQKGGGTHFGVSRQATGDTTNLPFIQYAARVQRTNGSTTTGGMDFFQCFETANSIPYAGRTVTLSFYARKGANYSATSDLLSANIYTGTGTDQNLVAGSYTGQTQPLSFNATLTSSWQRFSGTATLSASMTEMTIYIIGTPTGTAGANDWYEITGVQIDIGSVALPYRRNSATLAGELAACQRYYIEYGGDKIFERFGGGSSDALTSGRVITHMPVPMRTTPSMTTTTTDWQLVRPGIAGAAATAITLSSDESSTKIAALTVTIGSTAGFGDSKAVVLCANSSTSARIRLSAEL